MAENNSSAPLKTAEGAICERCAGSGEDPEGFMTHGHGPDDYSVDGPCRQCGGTGEPAVVTRNYSDGTAATGVGPLPDLSPNQQQVKTALSGLDAVEAMLGGANGPTIQIRAALERAQAVEAQAAPAAVAVPDERWCPDVCPITGREFFMWVTHHESGDDVPTYGGPFDSYTIPTQDKDGSFSCERYDHDFGGWKDWENVGLMLVDDQSFVVAPDNPRYYEIEQFATPALPATEHPSAGDLAEARHQTKLLAQALGDCIIASGIVRSDLEMSGPQLLMFAEDLKEQLLARQAVVQAEPVAWINHPVIVDRAGNFAGYGHPELSFKRPPCGFAFDKAQALYTAPQAQPAPVQAEPVAFTAAQRERLYRNKPKNTGSGLSLADWHRVVKFIESAQSHKQTVIQAQPGAMELWEALCDSRATLHAISQTLDDHELRGAAKEAYEKASTLTCPSTAPQAQPTDALDAREVVGDLAYALELLVGTDAMHSLCQQEAMDVLGRVKGTWSAAAEANARATLKTHAATLAAMAAAQEGGNAATGKDGAA